MTEVPMNTLATAYLNIRTEREALKKAFEAKDADLSAQMQELANAMLEVCKELEADSIKTPAGTIIRTTKSRYWTNDWDTMYQFIREHNAFGLLEKRLHQGNMKEFLQENPDILPMGLNVDSEYTITVRRAK